MLEVFCDFYRGFILTFSASFGKRFGSRSVVHYLPLGIAIVFKQPEYALSDVVNSVQNKTKRSARMHPDVANNKGVNEGHLILFLGEWLSV